MSTDRTWIGIVVTDDGVQKVEGVPVEGAQEVLSMGSPEAIRVIEEHLNTAAKRRVKLFEVNE